MNPISAYIDKLKTKSFKARKRKVERLEYEIKMLEETVQTTEVNEHTNLFVPYATRKLEATRQKYAKLHSTINYGT